MIISLCQVSTCQCFQCRKQTGSLIFRVHEVPTTAVSWTSDKTLQRYRASAGASRGFCNACGSLLFWHGDGSEGIAVCVGTFDKEVLLQYGPLLTSAKTHLYCSEEVPGVTDHLQGQRWKKSNTGESAKLLN